MTPNVLDMTRHTPICLRCTDKGNYYCNFSRTKPEPCNKCERDGAGRCNPTPRTIAEAAAHDGRQPPPIPSWMGPDHPALHKPVNSNPRNQDRGRPADRTALTAHDQGSQHNLSRWRSHSPGRQGGHGPQSNDGYHQSGSQYASYRTRSPDRAAPVVIYNRFGQPPQQQGYGYGQYHGIVQPQPMPRIYHQPTPQQQYGYEQYHGNMQQQPMPRERHRPSPQQEYGYGQYQSNVQPQPMPREWNQPAPQQAYGYEQYHGDVQQPGQFDFPSNMTITGGMARFQGQQGGDVPPTHGAGRPRNQKKPFELRRDREKRVKQESAEKDARLAEETEENARLKQQLQRLANDSNHETFDLRGRDHHPRGRDDGQYRRDAPVEAVLHEDSRNPRRVNYGRIPEELLEQDGRGRNSASRPGNLKEPPDDLFHRGGRNPRRRSNNAGISESQLDDGGRDPYARQRNQGSSSSPALEEGSPEDLIFRWRAAVAARNP